MNENEDGCIDRSTIRIKTALNSRPAQLASAIFTGLSFAATTITLGLLTKFSDPLTYFGAGAVCLFTTCRERRRQLTDQHHIEDEDKRCCDHERRLTKLEVITVEHNSSIALINSATDEAFGMIDNLISTVQDETKQEKLAWQYSRALEKLRQRPSIQRSSSQLFSAIPPKIYFPDASEKKADSILIAGFELNHDYEPAGTSSYMSLNG